MCSCEICLPLHLNGIHFLKRVIQDTRSIDCLESQVLVVKVTHKQALGGESVRLDVDVCPRDATQEARLANVGISADEEGSGVGIDRRQTPKMLPHLVEVQKRILEALDDGGHPTKRSTLQLLALEQRLAILEQADIVSGNRFNQMLGGRKLTESDAKVVGIVQGVEQILVERMNILQSGKALEDGAEFLGERLLREFDLSCIET